jgi:hypothetical protein
MHNIASTHGNEQMHDKGANTHGNVRSHGNDDGARQRLLPRQRNNAHNNDCEARQSLYRAYLARRTTNSVLPSIWHCRAWMHGNAFAMPIMAFAVQISRTTMLAFPVVSVHIIIVYFLTESVLLKHGYKLAELILFSVLRE